MPDQFWDLTWAEFRAAVAGYRQQVELTQELLAWHLVNLANGSGMRSRPLRMHDVLPQAKKSIPRPIMPGENVRERMRVEKMRRREELEDGKKDR